MLKRRLVLVCIGLGVTGCGQDGQPSGEEPRDSRPDACAFLGPSPTTLSVAGAFFDDRARLWPCVEALDVRLHDREGEPFTLSRLSEDICRALYPEPAVCESGSGMELTELARPPTPPTLVGHGLGPLLYVDFHGRDVRAAYRGLHEWIFARRQGLEPWRVLGPIEPRIPGAQLVVSASFNGGVPHGVDSGGGLNRFMDDGRVIRRVGLGRELRAVPEVRVLDSFETGETAGVIYAAEDGAVEFWRWSSAEAPVSVSRSEPLSCEPQLGLADAVAGLHAACVQGGRLVVATDRGDGSSPMVSGVDLRPLASRITGCTPPDSRRRWMVSDQGDVLTASIDEPWRVVGVGGERFDFESHRVVCSGTLLYRSWVEAGVGFLQRCDIRSCSQPRRLKPPRPIDRISLAVTPDAAELAARLAYIEGVYRERMVLVGVWEHDTDWPRWTRVGHWFDSGSDTGAIWTGTAWAY